MGNDENVSWSNPEPWCWTSSSTNAFSVLTFWDGSDYSRSHQPIHFVFDSLPLSCLFIFFSHSLSLCVCVFHGKTGHYRVGKQDSHVIGSLAWSATRVWWTHPRDFISRFGSGKFLLPRDVAIAGNAVVVVVLVDVSVCCQSRQMTRRAIFCFLDHLLMKNFWRLLVGCWWCQSLLVGPRQK